MTREESDRIIAAAAQEFIGRALEGADWTSPFAEIGLDSLDLASLLLSVEEKLGVRIPDADVDSLVSLRDISEYVASSKRLG